MQSLLGERTERQKIHDMTQTFGSAKDNNRTDEMQVLLLNRVVAGEGDEASPCQTKSIKDLGACIQPSYWLDQLLYLQEQSSRCDAGLFLIHFVLVLAGAVPVFSNVLVV